MEKTKDRETAFHILALDGGGVRGIYPAQMLADIERELQTPVRECFDLIVGTSTGSIIGGAVAVGIPMEEVVRLFKEKAPRIFRKRRIGAFYFRSKYSRLPLEQAVRGCVPDVTLGQISKPLMITASDISTGGVHVFKSRYLEDIEAPYVRDAQVLLSDAILSSCAAPTFFDPVAVGDLLLADGGLWANNPSINALTEAFSKFRKPVEQVHILSIGTGRSMSLYSRSKRWGFLTGWRRQKLVSYVMRLQSQASENMAKLFLSERYLRLDPEIEAWDLDDVGHLDELKALATRDFTLHSEAIMKNIRTPRSPDTGKPYEAIRGPAITRDEIRTSEEDEHE